MPDAVPTPEASRSNKTEVSPITARINQLQERLGCTEGPFAPVFTLARKLEGNPSAITHKQTFEQAELEGLDMQRLTELRIREQIDAVGSEEIPAELENLSIEQLAKLREMRVQNREPDFVALIERAIDLYVSAARHPGEILDPVTQQPLEPIDPGGDSFYFSSSNLRFAVNGSAVAGDPGYDIAKVTMLRGADFTHEAGENAVSVQLVFDESGWEDIEKALEGSDLGNAMTEAGEHMQGKEGESEYKLEVDPDIYPQTLGWEYGKLVDTRTKLGQKETIDSE